MECVKEVVLESKHLLHFEDLFQKGWIRDRVDSSFDSYVDFQKVVEKDESLQFLEENMNKTLRIKNGRDKEENMGMKMEEDEWFNIEMVKDAEKEENSKKFCDPAGNSPINIGRSQIYWGPPHVLGPFSGRKRKASDTRV
uniref:Uncharacterized protein n=1 Tax=Tanacetum cinerariifolium TaxID=118510 RepID=A0A699II38_TANCI|nr:hypothetical protein [Tanacetum cinerariifolium]